MVQTKKVISMNYWSSTSSWKPWRWVRLDLIFTMRDIYIHSKLNPLTKFTSSSRSTQLKDILSWNISQMITKTITISTRIVVSYGMKQGIPLWLWWKVLWFTSFECEKFGTQIQLFLAYRYCQKLLKTKILIKNVIILILKSFLKEQCA